MAAKQKAEAINIFRQFAWNLAGTLAGATERPAVRRPAKGAARARRPRR